MMSKGTVRLLISCPDARGIIAAVANFVAAHNGNILEVDARPSDAIALAVRTRAPIFADDAVIQKAGVEMDEETGKPIIASGDGTNARPLREEELKSLSAFTDFVETLNLEDLGNPTSPPSESP
ncbi:MAG: bifunctional nuclease family protein [Planctomycetes bacterium]|nr:bifunctional nuclease family protein [Planctomycetota bacterium]